MKAGRPKGSAQPKVRKGYFVGGRFEKRREIQLRRIQKRDMLETLIAWWLQQPEPDHEYVEYCKQRVDQIKKEIKVYSMYE
jgi:hypothetical protein